jgi:WhiB family transcriptional regulator, redox-sensing transcriptional regulator
LTFRQIEHTLELVNPPTQFADLMLVERPVVSIQTTQLVTRLEGTQTMSQQELPPRAQPRSAEQAAPAAENVPAARTQAPNPLALSVVDATWNNLAWRSHAACSSLDTNLFFPVGLTGYAIDQTNLAKAVCNDCPVRNQCLEFALRTLQDHGVWGGHTEEERRVIRRARRAAARRAALAQKAQAS